MSKRNSAADAVKPVVNKPSFIGGNMNNNINISSKGIRLTVHMGMFIICNHLWERINETTGWA
jgi:hypothetical protein